MMSDHLNATGLSPRRVKKVEISLRARRRKDYHSLSQRALQLQTVRSILRDTIATPLSTIKSPFNGMPKISSVARPSINSKFSKAHQAYPLHPDLTNLL
ncbi:hypothetical protein Pst134EA_022899 [Puccinia striiformis f. sp. tritici]|uniref:hypothetical protein n=1 Tax=Puccinia striiformis f. sp. tritici TaxID=168172 RepID=UPI002008A296|nr:hypothetical protein Pst134EA_022899 [Puccinia striiformis f. sp. tritici]KAH9455434.1 hypothetical protein Pst134EA_022899 [Puccinia striiformis f. sp. tritici]